MRVMITGATGFVGRALAARLLEEGGIDVRAAIRRDARDSSPDMEQVIVGDLRPDTEWASALAQVDAVVHLAARVRVMRDLATDPFTEFRRVNVAGSLHLARQAAAAGVRRFVFMSSVKVSGERGVYRESDPPAPRDPYSVSKHEAELGLRDIAFATGMEVVIIRSPLVYGPGVQANFQKLARAVLRGIPLPFGAVHNRRSLVAVDNLVDFILRCIEHPRAANEIFFVSDGEDISTTDLIRRLGLAVDRPARLIPIPAFFLKAIAIVLGHREEAQRLLGSLQVDISKARRLLDWNPKVSVDEGLRRAATAL